VFKIKRKRKLAGSLQNNQPRGIYEINSEHISKITGSCEPDLFNSTFWAKDAVWADGNEISDLQKSPQRKEFDFSNKAQGQLTSSNVD
jgi:hypothetical protein